MIGSWQAEAVLVAACSIAIGWLARRSRAPGGLAVATALALLAAAALLGGLLFAGLAPSLGAAHDAASTLFSTLGFAIVAVVLIGGDQWRWWQAAGLTGLLALAGLAIPLAPAVLLAHIIAWWRHRSRWRQQAPAAAAMAAVIIGQVAVRAGPARLDTLHLTLAAWVIALAAAV